MEKWEEIFKKISFLEKEFVKSGDKVKADIKDTTQVDLARQEMNLDEKEWLLEEKEKKVIQEMQRLRGEERQYFEGIVRQKEAEIQALKSETAALKQEFNEEIRAREKEISLIRNREQDQINTLEKLISEKDAVIEKFKEDFLNSEKNWRETIDKTNKTFAELGEGLHKEIQDLEKRNKDKVDLIEKDWQSRISAERSKFQDTIFKLERKSKRYIRILKNLYVSSKNFGYFLNEVNQKFFEVVMHDLDLAISTSYYSLTKIVMKSKIRDNFSIVSKSVQEAKDFILKLDEFIRLKSRQFANLSAMSLISRLESKYYDLAEKNKIKLTFIAPPGLPDFKGEEDLLFEAMSYLMDNSFEAITGEGEINVIGHFNPELDHVTITLTDSGIGIPFESKERVFLPFYTTKKGRSGLGMTKAKLIAYLHNGDILIETKDRGVSIALILPSIVDAQEGI